MAKTSALMEGPMLAPSGNQRSEEVLEVGNEVVPFNYRGGHSEHHITEINRETH